MRLKFYCAKCWQEFDHPRDHNSPSAFKGERLNGYCDGEVLSRKQEAGSGVGLPLSLISTKERR